jgi:hypothetical protein
MALFSSRKTGISTLVLGGGTIFGFDVSVEDDLGWCFCGAVVTVLG